MHYLLRNQSAYEEHFAWRKQLPRVSPSYAQRKQECAFTHASCRLCRELVDRQNKLLELTDRTVTDDEQRQRLRDSLLRSAVLSRGTAAARRALPQHYFIELDDGQHFGEIEMRKDR